MKNRISILLVVLLGFSLMSASLGQTPRNRISTEQIRRFIFEQHNLVKECDGQEAITRLEVEDYDFDGDGQYEVVVNAMTCAMGNGGNDILAVYTLRENKLVELPIECLGEDESCTIFEGARGHLGLSVSSRGPLVLNFQVYSSSDDLNGRTREVFYKWDNKNKKFNITDIVTSY